MRQLLKTTIMFISSLLLFAAVVYAWFTNTNTSILQPTSVNVINRNVDLDVEYGINGGGYESFDEPANINAYLSALAPGDRLDLRVTIQNTNAELSPDMQLQIMMRNIRASQTTEAYDLTDFFYLYDGKIDLTWYASYEDFITSNSYQQQTIYPSLINNDSIDYLGLPLEMYRLSNLFRMMVDGENTIIQNDIEILETTLASKHIIVVTFSIAFDPYTPDMGVGFQDGELFIDGLYAFFGD